VRKELLNIDLQGGLGNQLFQLAALKYASDKNNLVPTIDLSRITSGRISRDFGLENCLLKKLFNESLIFKKTPNVIFTNRLKWFAQRFLPNLFFSKTFFARNLGYENKLENLGNFRSLNGYFQTHRYVDFINWKSSLNNYRTCTPEFLRLRDEVESINPVGIHIRGGDYLRDKSGIGNLSSKYFLNCINELGPDQEILWIFTDDPPYAQHLMDRIGYQYKIIDIQRKLSAFETMLLFASTRKIIISNSTFAWWSAYLSNSAIVFCPQKWFQGLDDPIDLIPQEWVKIESQWS